MIRLLFSLLLITAFGVCSAQNVSEIEIGGNERFSDGFYLEEINFTKGSRYFAGMEDSIGFRISRALKNKSHFHFSIDISKSFTATDSSEVSLSININESKPAFIKKFNISGLNPTDSSLVLERLEYLLDKPLIPDEVNFELKGLLNVYEDKGYPFTNFKIDNITFTENEDNYSAELFVKFSKEKQSRIDKIVVEGNEKTNDNVVIRELRLEKGSLYNQKKIDEIPSVLNRLRFFEPVDPPEFYFDPENNGVLKISVNEKQTNNFDGIVGYVPSTNDEEDGFFTGYVNISLRNLFGTGRAVGLLWEKKERLSQELRLKYLEPWIFSLPVNISGELFQRKQDTTYINQKYGIDIEYLASETISAGFTLAAESTIPTDNEDETFTVFNSSSITTGFSFKLDTSDDYYAPTSGVMFINSYSFSQKKIKGPEDFLTPETDTEVNLQRIELNFNFFRELFRRQVVAVKLNGRELRGDFFEISDLYPLGGTNSLRGYRERQFLGNRVFWSNLEYRYLLTRRTFAFVFFDTGYFLRNEDIERDISRQSDFKTGYGFGLNLETGLGVLGVSYALGEGDSFSTGKLHFGIINEF